jgi:hypothetical protein
MPHGKPAGIPCVQLLPDLRCAIYGRPERPAVCNSLRPTEEMCGTCQAEALRYLAALELATRPIPSPDTDRTHGAMPVSSAQIRSRSERGISAALSNTQ